MTRVGVVGHIEWVDFLPVPRFPRRGEVIHAEGGFLRAGGGGGVAAIVLAELGAEVDFFCALGDDVAGRAALAQLEERGVCEGIDLWVTWPGRDAECGRRQATGSRVSGALTIRARRRGSEHGRRPQRRGPRLGPPNQPGPGRT